MVLMVIELMVMVTRKSIRGSHISTDGFPKNIFLELIRTDLLAAVKINCSYFPFMLMMLLPTHGEDQQTPRTISPPVMMIKDNVDNRKINIPLSRKNYQQVHNFH